MSKQQRRTLLLLAVPVLLLSLVGLVVVAIVFKFRHSAPPSSSPPSSSPSASSPSASSPSASPDVGPSAPSKTCVPYTTETRCVATLRGCLGDTKPRSAGWYMMTDSIGTGKCEEKFDDGCNYPTCDPATHFETKAECETACRVPWLKRSWPELVGKPKDEAKAIIVAESPDNMSVRLLEEGEPITLEYDIYRVPIWYDPATGLVSRVPGAG